MFSDMQRAGGRCEPAAGKIRTHRLSNVPNGVFLPVGGVGA